MFHIVRETKDTKQLINLNLMQIVGTFLFGGRGGGLVNLVVILLIKPAYVQET